MSLRDMLTGQPSDEYSPIQTVDFSAEGEAIVTLAPLVNVQALELLDPDGELVQSRQLNPAQWVAIMPLRQNQPIEYELVGGGRITTRVPRSERQRLDLDPGPPLPPGDYTLAAGRRDGAYHRQSLTIPPEAALTD